MTDTTFEGRQQYAIAESQTMVFETVSFPKKIFSRCLFLYLFILLFISKKYLHNPLLKLKIHSQFK